MKRFLIALTGIMLATLPLSSEAATKPQRRGKIDFGPVFIKSKVFYNEQTRDDLDLWGARINGTIRIYKGLVFKPSLVTAHGQGDLTSGGAALGFYIPIERFSIQPVAGINFTNLSFATQPLIPPGGSKAKREQRFNTRTPFVGVHFSFKPNPCWLFSLSFEYGWAHSKTTIRGNIPNLNLPTVKTDSKGVIRSDEESKGPTVAFAVDYYFYENFTVNLGVLYNRVWEKSRNGVRGHGIRIGTGYVF